MGDGMIYKTLHTKEQILKAWELLLLQRDLQNLNVSWK